MQRLHQRCWLQYAQRPVSAERSRKDYNLELGYGTLLLHSRSKCLLNICKSRIWCKTKPCTASAYLAFFIGQHSIQGAKLLMKTKALGHYKFFIWLVLHDRCWTAERRKRHNLQDDDSCSACLQISESISHILIDCVIAREVWSTVLRRWNLNRLTPQPAQAEFVDRWQQSRKQIQCGCV